MIHYFIWKNVDSRVMFIRVPNRVPVIRPEERVEHVTIPGRSGELTVTEGTDIYQSYIQTVTVTVAGNTHVRDAEEWLRGEGFITFDTQPDLKQKARIIGALTFEKHSKNLDYWHADVQFYCEPLKRMRTDPEAIVLNESGTTVTNPSVLTAKPKIAISGSGAVTVSVGGRTLTIPECVDGWVIDSENEWILQNGIPRIGACSGSFPVLAPGDNTVLFTGATGLTVTPEWRFI